MSDHRDLHTYQYNRYILDLLNVFLRLEQKIRKVKCLQKD